MIANRATNMEKRTYMCDIARASRTCTLSFAGSMFLVRAFAAVRTVGLVRPFLSVRTLAVDAIVSSLLLFSFRFPGLM